MTHVEGVDCSSIRLSPPRRLRTLQLRLRRPSSGSDPRVGYSIRQIQVIGPGPSDDAPDDELAAAADGATPADGATAAGESERTAGELAEPSGAPCKRMSTSSVHSVRDSVGLHHVHPLPPPQAALPLARFVSHAIPYAAATPAGTSRRFVSYAVVPLGPPSPLRRAFSDYV